MKPINTSCSGCGAPLYSFDQPFVQCEYCGLTYINSDLSPGSTQGTGQSLAPQISSFPDIGDLLLAADFNDPRLQGWVRYFKDKTEIRRLDDSTMELVGNFPEEDTYNTILCTAGTVDNCDISADFRFIDGVWDQSRAGIELRHNDEGDYLVAISPQGTFCIGYHNGSDWGGYLQNWNDHPALIDGWGKTNRLRVILRGDQLRVYLNGKMAASLRDTRYLSPGRVMFAISPIKGPATVGISNVQLRDVYKDD